MRVRGWAAGLIAAGLACAQTWKLPPKNEEGRDATLAAFLKSLRETVVRKDTAALLEAITPDIKNGFGGDDGAAAFRTSWELQKPNSPVFAVLQNVLSLGGTWFDAEQYCAPYVSASFPEGIDPFEHHAVIGDGVRLRAEPSSNAAVVARLSYDIVETLDRGAEWTQVKTHQGTVGYVASAYLYSPVGYRACFVKDASGKWRMRSLLAGD
jgi:hypothetical protein